MEQKNLKDIESPLLTSTSPGLSSLFELTEYSPGQRSTSRFSQEKPCKIIQETPPRWKLRGVYYQLLASLCQVGMGAVRKIVPHIPSAQMLFARTPFIMAVIVIYLFKTNKMSELRRSFNMRMMQMAGFSTLTAAFFFTSIVSLPLSDAMTIFSTGAITNGIVAAIFLHEPYTLVDKLLGGLSCLGVLLIVRPPFIFGDSSTADPAAPTTFETETPRYVAALLMLLATLSNSGTVVSLRSIKARYDLFAAPFQVSFVMFIVYGLYYLFVEQYNPLSFGEYFIVCVFGMLNLGTIYFLAAALESESSSTVGIVTHSQLIYSVILDLVIFGTLPSLMTLAGASIIIGCCVYLIAGKSWVSQRLITNQK